MARPAPVAVSEAAAPRPIAWRNSRRLGPQQPGPVQGASSGSIIGSCPQRLVRRDSRFSQWFVSTIENSGILSHESIPCPVPAQVNLYCPGVGTGGIGQGPNLYSA